MTDFGTGQKTIICNYRHFQVTIRYRNYWNRSRPSINLDSKIPRLVLEAFPKVLFFGQFFLHQPIKNGPNRAFLKDLNFWQ